MYSSVTREYVPDELLKTSYKTCALGRWLHNEEIKKLLSNFENYKKVVIHHQKLHEIGQTVFDKVLKEGVTKNNEDWYVTRLKELENEATEVFSLLQKILDNGIKSGLITKILEISQKII